MAGASAPARSSLRRAIAWTSGGQVILFAAQIVSQVVLARLLTPRELGVFTAALAMTSLVTAFQGVGLNQLVIREAEHKVELVETAFTINALISVVLAAAIYGLGFVGAAIYHDATMHTVMAILAVPPLLGIFQFLPAAILQRDMHFHWLSSINVVRVVASAGITIALAARGAGAASLGWGALAGALVSAVLFAAVDPRRAVVRPRLHEWRAVATFGLQMLAISGVTVLSSRLADLVLGRVLGLGALGIYSRASGVNALLWENIHAVLGRIFLSDLADRQRRGEKLRDAYLRILEALTALLWPAFAGLAVLARPLVETVYGAQWEPAADPLSLLAIASIVLISVSMTWEIFVICAETGLQAKIEAKRNAMGLGVFVLGCLVSLTAAAGARILDALVSVTLYRRPLSRMTGTGWADMLPIYRRSLMLTAAAITPSLALMIGTRFAYSTSFALVLASAAAGVLLWLAALRAMRHPLYGEMRVVGEKLSARALRAA